MASEANQYHQDFLTDNSGALAVNHLPFGIYHVSVEHQGFAPFSGSVEIRSTIPAEYETKLAVAQLNTAVVVKEEETPAANWDLIDQMRKGINIPVLIKGIMTPEEAEAAVKRGVQGIVVSNYGGLLTPGMATSVEMLPSIDGSFRRVPIFSRLWLTELWP
jgi:isopentenyl diphosphate isomerase/L-lactate dehydrogenase-like FMN-dependent dehydrogenase